MCAFFIFCVLQCFDILKNLSVGDTALPGPARSQGRQRAQPGHACDLPTNPGHAFSVCPVPGRQYPSAFSILGWGPHNQGSPPPKATELVNLARPDCSPHLFFLQEPSKGLGPETTPLPSPPPNHLLFPRPKSPIASFLPEGPPHHLSCPHLTNRLMKEHRAESQGVTGGVLQA